MPQSRARQCATLFAATSFITLGGGIAARAANLLVNPGFEAPPGTSNVDSTVAGWTLQFDAQRATFHNHTPGGTEAIWAKTFQPQGGVSQVVGITAGATYNFSSFLYFESAFPTTGANIDLKLTWNTGSPSQLVIPSSSITTTDAWTPFSFSAVAPAGATSVEAFLGWDTGQTVTGAQSAFFDDVVLDGPGTAPTNSVWITNGGGDYNNAANWANGTVPTGVGAQADFLGAITTPHTVYSDVAITAGSLNFDNTNMYVLTGAGSLTVQAAGAAAARIHVLHGTQKINLPMTLASNTNMDVDAGATLLISNPVTIAANKTLTKTGTVLVQAPLTIQSGGGLVLASGPTSLFGAPSIAAGGKVDVKNNTLTIDYHGQTTPAATIRSQLTSGYAGGSWNGSGINTSSATANTGLGWNDSAANQAITIKYAYYGDSNLDGKVDLTDFTFLAANFNGASKDWQQGDFNYDGTVNLTDFTFLAANFNKSLPAESLGAAVPEPMSFGVFVAGLALVGRGRRTRR